MSTAAELLLALSPLTSGTASEHLLAVELGTGTVYVGPTLSATHTEQSATAERTGPVLSSASSTQTTVAQYVRQALIATAITQTNEATHG